MTRPVNTLRVNFGISSNSKAGEQLDPKDQLWNEWSGLGRLWDINLLLCVLRWTGANCKISQVSYTATECKRIDLSALEPYLWGSFVPVLLLLLLWGVWVQPLRWARWWCLRNKIPSVWFFKGFLLTTGFLPPAHDSTGSMRLPVLDKYVSMVH